MPNDFAQEIRGTLLQIAAMMVGFGILVVLLKKFLGSLLSAPKKVALDLYEPIPFLLTESEKHFYEALYSAVGQNYLIYPKVGLSDLVDVTKNASKSEWQSAWNRISQKHVDFVLCSPGDYRVLAVIELDDKSHQRKGRQDRDKFVDEVLAATGLPILHIKAARDYDPQSLADSITALVSKM